MASFAGEASTSSSMPRPCTYKVFLSFRGEDTRKGFTSHLYTALVNRGITTYIDHKNLHKGDLISDELLTAIEESMFGVIVLSPNYASSTWCLDELHKIVECNNNLGLQIVAVFYYVKPCDVRHQIGAFEEAFKKHELRFGQDSERVRRWRNALKQVADYSNWDSEQFENEAILVESITQHIHGRLTMKLPSSMKHLVGIDSRLEEVVRHIDIGVNDARFIGICGMGGIGKTTIARRVYEAIRSEFKASCFLAEVRETCEKRGIVQIQKQLLASMNISSNTFNDEFVGRGIIRESLCCKNVLLVLDDVDDEGQLENLAGEQDWFGPGSRIIITTRDIHVLHVHGAVNRICKVEGLEKNEALELFCWKAFKRPKPEEGYMDLSKEVVEYCDGLPLALVVLGSHLCGRTIHVWRSAIEKTKSFLEDKIFNILKISYDGLGHMEKNIFLDIACFFKGKFTNHVTNILNRCGYHAEIGIATLIDKSLLTRTNDDECDDILRMHDLLEDMGKHIVKQESLNDLSKCSRLWTYKDVECVLTQNKENEATHSIVLYNTYSEIERNWGDLDIRDLSFSNLWQLKLLILDGVKVPILCDIPCTLKVLHWKGCPMETLPFTNQHYELVEIDLFDGNIVQLWDGNMVLEKLEHLNLSWCLELKQTPDLSGAPNLKKLDLLGCEELNYIHPSVVHHRSLVVLDLRQCKSLETLGDNLEMSSLERLYLECCSSLRRLPDLSGAPNLITLDLSKCEELDYIHPSLAHHKRLVELDLTECRSLETLGDKLEMSSLERLDLECCSSLRRLPDLSGVPNLKKLGLRRCEELDYIHPSLAHHKRLVELDLSKCRSLETLGDKLEMSSLEKLHLYKCSSLRRLPEFGECMKQLSILSLAYTDIEELPPTIRNLAGVSELDFTKCNKLTSIHELPRLTNLRLLCCDKLEVLSELPSSLRVLQALDCHSLDVSNVNDAISKACCGFAESASQDREDFLQMMIDGKEIPAWFEHQEQDNGVSVSFSSTETIALALCFLFHGDTRGHPSVICNGKEFIITSSFNWWCISDNLCIVCVNGYYLSNLVCHCQHNRFQLLFPNNYEIRVQSSGARWVCKQDIQDFKKRKSQTGKRKATLQRIMDISHSSPSTSGKRMLVVAPPQYEQEEERDATAEGPIRHLASRKSSDPPQLLPLFPLLPSSHSS